MSCRRVREWLHRDSESLGETELLQLDDHLASCARCRSDREHLQLLRQAGASLLVPPSGAREYNRAIARALLEGSTRTAPARPTMWLVPATIGAFAVAAVIAIGVVARRGDHAAPQAAQHDPVALPQPAPAPPVPLPPAPPPTEPTDMVEDGTLALAATTLSPGDAIPAELAMRATVQARVRLAVMRVVIAASSQIRWSPSARVLLLERGTIDVDADATDRAEHVVTASFDVEVSDAALTVEPGVVRVRRGAVRIVDRKGKLLAHLEAEGTWEPAGAPAIRKLPAAGIRQVSAADMLAGARGKFAEKHYDAAEMLAERALSLSDVRREQADIQIFAADVSQAAGKLELAVARYETVATKFSELPAGESALYAAARIELRRGRISAANVLLDRYLDRYPTGRYADDVRRQRVSPP